MRILIITNDTKFSSVDTGRFRDFGDPSDIEIKYGFDAGMEFILNYVIGHQKHIDFIIISKQKKPAISTFGYKDYHIDDFAV